MSRSAFAIVLLLFNLMLVTFVDAQETFQLKPYYRSVKLSGLTRPRKEMTITSEVSGRCVQLYADVGESIPQSGKLAEIDRTYLELDLQANKIAQELAQRKLFQEKKTLERYTVLIEKQSTAQAEYDEIALNADLTELSLKDLQNEEARLREKLIRHTIRGPVGWQLIERFTEPGEFVQEGKKIAHLGDFRDLLVKLAVTYRELQTLKGLPELFLHLPDLGERVEAIIYQTSPIFDEKTRKIPMELIIHVAETEFESLLRGGMRAELEFQSITDTNTYSVPSSALIRSYDAHWLVAADGSQRQIILLDEFDETATAVITGNNLSAGLRFLRSPEQNR